MKRINKFFKWIPAIFVYLYLSTISYAQETIQLTNGEWAPYASKTLKHNGVGSRIITEAFALVDVKVEYEFFPWSRALMYAEDGDRDGSVLWYYHSDRAKNFYYSDYIMVIDQVFFHLKSLEFNWEKWSDLEGLQVGSTIGYTVTKVLKENQETGKFSLETAPTDEINFRKLLQNRINIFPMPAESGLYTLENNFTKDEANLITYHPKVTTSSGKVYLILSKKIPGNKRILKLFNKGLKQLKESGKYDQYIEQSR